MLRLALVLAVKRAKGIFRIHSNTNMLVTEPINLVNYLTSVFVQKLGKFQTKDRASQCLIESTLRVKKSLRAGHNANPPSRDSWLPITRGRLGTWKSGQISPPSLSLFDPRRWCYWYPIFSGTARHGSSLESASIGLELPTFDPDILDSVRLLPAFSTAESLALFFRREMNPLRCGR